MSTFTDRITWDNISVQFISSTGQPMRIKDNLYVLCKEETFSLSLMSTHQPANCHIYMQGSNVPTAHYRITPKEWSNFTCGINGLTFVAVPTTIEDAKDLGIIEGSDSNGAIKFIIHRPKVRTHLMCI